MMNRGKQLAPLRIERCQQPDLILAAARPALADVDQWLSPQKLTFLLNEEIFIAFLASGDHSYGAAEPLGVIMGGIEEEGRVWIEILAVHPRSRRLGVATALIHRLQATARAMGARGLMVDVDDDNTAARRFYKRVGFQRVGYINQYYYDRSKALVYFCPL